jgi:RNA polymerase sigma-70 factor (ECF subfamily)
MDRRRLLAAAQAGDERAFRELVGPYRRALEVHCYRMLGSGPDAEDVTQETLLRAWRALERFEPRAQLQTWLYRIATNACLDELERRPRRPEPVDPLPERPADERQAPIYDPAARYAIREGLELALMRAIQELPGRQRAVLIFRDVLGWTAPEVAELLDSTVASVNSALQRARARIELRLPTPAPTATDPRERELVRRYVDAFARDDVDGLVALLQADATLRMPPQRTLSGAAAIARFFRETVGRGDLRRIELRPTRANGRPAVAIFRTEKTREAGETGAAGETGEFAAHGISVLEIAGGQIAAIDAFIDPALPARFGFAPAPLTEPAGGTP